MSTARLAAQDAYYSRMSSQPSPNNGSQARSIDSCADTPTAASSHAGSEEPVVRSMRTVVPEPQLQQHQSDVRSDDYDSPEPGRNQFSDERPSTPRMRRHKSFHLRS